MFSLKQFLKQRSTSDGSPLWQALTQYSTRLATDNSNPAILLYLVLLLLAGSLFIAVNASPELNHLVNTGIGSRNHSRALSYHYHARLQIA